MPQPLPVLPCAQAPSLLLGRGSVECWGDKTLRARRGRSRAVRRKGACACKYTSGHLSRMCAVELCLHAHVRAQLFKVSALSSIAASELLNGPIPAM